MGSQGRGQRSRSERGGSDGTGARPAVGVGLVVGMVLLATVATGPTAAVLGDTTEIGSCTTIDSSGTYVLNTSLLVDAGVTSCIDITASDVVFDGNGHTIEGANDTGAIGIDVAGSTTLTNVTVTNVTVTGWDSGVQYNDTAGGNVTDLDASENLGRGVNLTGAADATVRNVTASRNGQSGVDLGASSTNVTLDAVTANENDADGISLDSGAANATLRNVTASDNGADGIDVRTANNTVRAGVVTDNDADGILIDGANNTVEDNAVHRNGGDHGILVSSGNADNSVLGNDASNNTGEGIEVDGSDTLVEDNRANANGGDGIRGGSDNTLLNNTAHDNGRDGIEIEARTVATDGVTEGNGRYGFHLDAADNATVRRIEARNNDGSGVWISASDDAVVEDAVAVNNTGSDAAGVYLRGGADVVLRNLTLRNNVHGVDTGVSDARDVLVVDSTINGSSEAAIDAERGVNLTGENVTFDRFVADFNATHVTLDPRDPATAPLLPDDTDDVGVLANVTTGTSPPEPSLVFAPRYEEAAADGIDEGTIRIWRHHQGWTEVGGTVDTEANRVEANLSSSGTFAPLGRTLPNFTPEIDATGGPVTEGGTLTVNATVENVGGTAGSQTVALEVDGHEVDTESVSLDSDGNATLSLRWETESGDAGSHSVTVTTADATASTTVDVEAESDGGGGARAPAEAGQDAEAETVATADQADSRESDGATVVSVSGAVRADEPARFATRTRDTADDAVAVDDVTLTADRSTTVSLTVSQSAELLPGVPSFTNPRGTDARGFVSIDHDISDEQVRDVSIGFRVRKDRLGPDEAPGDVALYRRAEGTWNELPTSQVGETETHLLFEAESPDGLSDFTVGVKQARFEIADALVSVTELTPGEGTQVRVRVTNTGGADGGFRVELLLDDRVVERRTLTVAAGGTRQTVFDRSFDRPGEYEVAVNNVSVGTVRVQPAATADGGAGAGSGGTTATATPTSTGFVPGFGPLEALAGVVLAALLFARRHT